MATLVLGTLQVALPFVLHAEAAEIHFTEPPAFESSDDGLNMSIIARNIASDCDPRGSCAAGGYIGATSVQLWAFTGLPPTPIAGQATAVDLSNGFPLVSTGYLRYDAMTGRSDAKSDFVPYTGPPPGVYTLVVLILGSGATLSTVVLFDSYVAGVFNISALPPASPNVRVVEYYDASFDHYFMTPLASEVSLCDVGNMPCAGWAPTGFTFGATRSGINAPSLAGVCRFYNDSFVPSSHFYALHGEGCEETLQDFPDWRLESSDLFRAQTVPPNGACPIGSIPVYRLYNNGRGGAPNHRFVTDPGERQRMIDAGWISEGYGALGVGMCAPQ
jgi:Repeat of unknown function (DUF5648)